MQLKNASVLAFIKYASKGSGFSRSVRLQRTNWAKHSSGVRLTNVGHVGYNHDIVIVNIAEAKAQLSQLAARASRGEEIILARHGQPIARIVPLEDVVPAAPHRGFGIGRNDFSVPSDFDDPLADEILDTFEAGNIFDK